MTTQELILVKTVLEHAGRVNLLDRGNPTTRCIECGFITASSAAVATKPGHYPRCPLVRALKLLKAELESE